MRHFAEGEGRDGWPEPGAKLAKFSEHWSPKIIQRFNGHDVMVVKVKDEFVWHSHGDTDDFFLVLKGKLNIQLGDREVHLGPGDLFVVPKAVERRPVAEKKRTSC